MSTPPKKRQRTGDASTVRRSDIWHADGSVVLHAEDTQFRVHWGILSHNSPFFRDLQELPQPSDQPIVDGCPVVKLHDAVEDLKHLLAALYDPTVLFQKALPFPVVAALIRLGRKYDFRKLLDAAVGLVMEENPTTLEGFQLRTSVGSKKVIGYTTFDMLALVRENDILSALPCAYFNTVKNCTQSQLFDGLPRPDGTMACLAAIDLRRCNLSREKLMMKQIKPGYTLGFLRKWDYDGECADSSTSRCTKTREMMFSQTLEPLKIYSLSKQWDKWEDYFCAACFRHVKELVNVGQQKMWQELPSFFDLPPWDELKNDI